MSTAREVMAGSGLEDRLMARQLRVNSSQQATAGPDWIVVDEGLTAPDISPDFPDAADYVRFRGIVRAARADGSGPADVISELDQARNLCAKPRFNFEVRSSAGQARRPSNTPPLFFLLYRPAVLRAVSRVLSASPTCAGCRHCALLAICSSAGDKFSHTRQRLAPLQP